MNIKAVVFDLDDTLFPERDYAASGFNAVSEILNNKYGIPDSRAELNSLFDDSPIGVFDRFATLHSDIITADVVKELVSTYRNHTPQLTLSQDIKTALVNLRKSGYKLGIITDGRPIGQRKKIDALGLNALVDEIIITDELGGKEFRKPDPRAFKKMSEALGVALAQMLYVGDNPQKDFAVKKELPIRTVRVMTNSMYKNSDYACGIKPDYIVDDIQSIIVRCLTDKSSSLE
ncbi:MAG: HAD-IA family hydrolase [Clostridiales bacterium]|nr:HAD-IA family hydrolase [Clostridiales bacterium]